MPRPDAESAPTAERLQAQKMDSIGLLAPGVAHEINNQLASILAVGHNIRTDPSLPPGVHNQAELLIQETRRTQVLVNRLLDFARQRPPERLPTSLREVVDDVLGLQSYTFGTDRIDAIVDIPDEIPAITLDRAQIEQVLVNLTLNAARAVQAVSTHGTVRIAAKRTLTDDGKDVVRLSITDDGAGIPPELRSGLFVPSTMGAPDERSDPGLPVSFGIVASHGGSLRHEDGPGGKGTTFIVELPVNPDGAESRPPSTGPAQVAGQAPALPPVTVPAAATLTDSATVRILVLDDDDSIRDFLVRILRRNGYDAVAAADGASALEIIRRDPPRAILCDYRMAGMSGIAFHEAVAALDPGLARRFAFMSGDVHNAALHDFAVARGILVLAKPFDIEGVGRAAAQIAAS